MNLIHLTHKPRESSSLRSGSRGQPRRPLSGTSQSSGVCLFSTLHGHTEAGPDRHVPLPSGGRAGSPVSPTLPSEVSLVLADPINASNSQWPSPGFSGAADLVMQLWPIEPWPCVCRCLKARPLSSHALPSPDPLLSKPAPPVRFIPWLMIPTSHLTIPARESFSSPSLRLFLEPLP